MTIPSRAVMSGLVVLLAHQERKLDSRQAQWGIRNHLKMWFDRLSMNCSRSSIPLPGPQCGHNAAHHERVGIIGSVRPCILDLDVIDRFVLGLKDRSSAGSSRPTVSEPEQLSGPYEPELGKVGPESGEIR